ncbi:hypothetical protein ACTXPS_16010 [Brachybacterium tyrofermentans]|uniref:hypothetical protein n=1 Tax=Brachybacterium tyrofermentans TaxID=47848 RepID=UPI003FD4209B
MPAPDERICSRTGLALVASPVSALRIARESYGPLDPVARASNSGPEAWSRYDTPGRTIYACADRVTAYMELLAPYRTDVSRERRALQPIADALGKNLDELWRDIVAEWDETGSMKASWLPRTFREGRRVYALAFPAGSWIDITATETITALENMHPHPWPTADGPLEEPLTLAHLTGDDRTLTTAIARVLRNDVRLDDGTRPLGVRFLSKHGHPAKGTGLCWAYWMRDVDNGAAESTTITHHTSIGEHDPDLAAVQAYCTIKAR